MKSYFSIALLFQSHGQDPPCALADVGGKNFDGGAVIELFAVNQLNFSQHQISTCVRQALNKGNEVGNLRILRKSLFLSLSRSFFLALSFSVLLFFHITVATCLLTGSSWLPGKVSI